MQHNASQGLIPDNTSIMVCFPVSDRAPGVFQGMVHPMTTTQVDLHPLDNAAWASLTGPHAHFAQGTAKALRYPPDVSPFVAVPPVVDAEVWPALAHLVGPGRLVALSGAPGLLDQLPVGWEVSLRGEGVQLVASDAFVSAPDPEALVLGADDVEEMLDLVARTKPGPFLPRTYLLGTYLGIRRNGALVAMAGERLHPPGWTEISAVCTDPAFRGQGLATRLVRAVGHGIRERGETPLMHASATNTNAIGLYGSIGFVLRRRTRFFGLRTPEHPGP
jgi:ribosomal protein S18 acetylase RimI-like enzyme